MYFGFSRNDSGCDFGLNQNQGVKRDAVLINILEIKHMYSGFSRNESKCDTIYIDACAVYEMLYDHVLRWC